MAHLALRDGSIKCGTLIKEGGSHKSFKMRFIIVREGELTYYENDKQTTPLGTLPLKGATCEAEETIAQTAKQKKASSNTFHFLVQLAEERKDKKDGHKGKYRFICDDLALRDSWVKAVKKAAGQEDKKSALDLVEGLAGQGMDQLTALAGIKSTKKSKKK